MKGPLGNIMQQAQAMQEKLKGKHRKSWPRSKSLGRLAAG
ncbi:MAG: hypothetical protein Ct9H300mP14_14900 [Gammaproteobacteria bacterium]|nr:MAG: hypothetical protein Ct9H300mP14_14900 [Gammaproteobacteria bacterium]